MWWEGKYKNRVAILDDARESISLGLMKNGIYDLNTTNPNQIATAGHALQDLAHLTNVHVDNNDYTEIPSGQIWIHHAWSGDIATAASYMPKNVNVDVVGYWFPPDGRGPVGNDTITVLRGAPNPVLAHLFLNYMLDLGNVLTNISDKTGTSRRSRTGCSGPRWPLRASSGSRCCSSCRSTRYSPSRPASSMSSGPRSRCGTRCAGAARTSPRPGTTWPAHSPSSSRPTARPTPARHSAT